MKKRYLLQRIERLETTLRTMDSELHRFAPKDHTHETSKQRIARQKRDVLRRERWLANDPAFQDIIHTKETAK